MELVKIYETISGYIHSEYDKDTCDACGKNITKGNQYWELRLDKNSFENILFCSNCYHKYVRSI